MVERNLAALVAGAFGSATQRSDGAFSVDQNFIAMMAVTQAETIRTKIKFIDATFGAVAKGTQFAERWEQMSKTLQRRSRERNDVVHAQWAISPDFPVVLIFVASDGKTIKYTVADLKGILDRISAERAETHRFLHDLLRTASTGELDHTSLGKCVNIRNVQPIE